MLLMQVLYKDNPEKEDCRLTTKSCSFNIDPAYAPFTLQAYLLGL